MDEIPLDILCLIALEACESINAFSRTCKRFNQAAQKIKPSKIIINHALRNIKLITTVVSNNDYEFRWTPKTYVRVIKTKTGRSAVFNKTEYVTIAIDKGETTKVIPVTESIDLVSFECEGNILAFTSDNSNVWFELMNNPVYKESNGIHFLASYQ